MDRLKLPLRVGPPAFAESDWVFRADDESMRGSGIVVGDDLYVMEVHKLNAALERVVVCRLNGRWVANRLTMADRDLVLVGGAAPRERVVIDEARHDFTLIGVVVGRAGPCL